jgi:hypothetical protein
MAAFAIFPGGGGGDASSMMIAPGYGCSLATLWILCMNSLSLPVAPPSPEFSEHQWLQLPAASGAVIAGTIGGWSCTTDAGWPAQIQLWCQQSIRNLPFELGRARKQLAKAISEAFNFLSQPPKSARAILRQIATPAQATPQISGAAAASQPLAKPPARSAKPPRK